MMKYGEIKMIRRERKNGMYTDRYTVIYENGKKVFTINGAMMKKHFEFIMAADCTAKYNKDGRHTADIFTVPAEVQAEEPAEVQTAEETAEEPAADQEPEEEASENYIAWCGMIDNDVITDEFETLSEAVDEVETQYNKDEMKAAGITFCKLLCNSGQWLECLEEKKVDDVFYGPFKKLYDVFNTFSARGLDIYSHKPERWSRNRPPVIALETEEAIYYCDERDKNDVIRFLNRNRTRANKK